MSDRYAAFDLLLLDQPATGVLRVTLNRPDKRNALDRALHKQVCSIWSVIDADTEIRVSIITGAGKAFCAGGDLDAIAAENPRDVNARFSHDFRSALTLAASMTRARKPIVSAINGPAVGAGLAIALLADVAIAARSATLMDGHLRIGVVPGDHAVLIWPLLCGLAKAKYFLMTNEPMTGTDAERCNLVALAVPLEELAERAVTVATRLAAVAPTALAMTKYVMNHWLRQNQPVFDLAAAFEMVNLQGNEASEAMRALEARTAPNFPDPSLF